MKPDKELLQPPTGNDIICICVIHIRHVHNIMYKDYILLSHNNFY